MLNGVREENIVLRGKDVWETNEVVMFNRRYRVPDMVLSFRHGKNTWENV